MRHALRIFLITLALVIIGLALTPKATPAQGTDPCDPDRPVPYGWHLRPAGTYSSGILSVIAMWPCGDGCRNGVCLSGRSGGTCRPEVQRCPWR